MVHNGCGRNGKQARLRELANDDNLTETTLNEAKKQIKNKNVEYIIMFEGDELSEDVEKLLTENKIEKLYFDSLTTLSKENKKAKKDYIRIMNDNLDIIKKELYKNA